jgi:hypothetical protein
MRKTAAHLADALPYPHARTTRDTPIPGGRLRAKTHAWEVAEGSQ